MIDKISDWTLLFTGSSATTLNIWAYINPNEWNGWVALVTGLLFALIALRRVVFFVFLDSREVLKWIKGWERSDFEEDKEKKDKIT